MESFHSCFLLLIHRLPSMSNKYRSLLYINYIGSQRRIQPDSAITHKIKTSHYFTTVGDDNYKLTYHNNYFLVTNLLILYSQSAICFFKFSLAFSFLSLFFSIASWKSTLALIALVNCLSKSSTYCFLDSMD